MKGKSKKPGAGNPHAHSHSHDGHDAPAGDAILASEPPLGTIARADEVAEPEKLVAPDHRPHPDYPHYRVEPGKRIDLSQVDPDQSEHYERKRDVQKELKRQRQRIRDLQAR